MTHVLDLLSAHLDGELTDSEETAVLSHLGSCEGCRLEFDAIAAVRNTVRNLPLLEAPTPLRPALHHPRRWITAAASIAAAALAFGLVVGPGEPAPFDLDTMAGQHTTRLGVDPGISALRGSVGAP